MRFNYKPLTIEQWTDFEILFGEKGACGGCWCMSWRLMKSEFDSNKGSGNKKLIKNIVKSGQIPGLLAYDKGTPIGWISFGPREVFPRMEKAPTLKSIDDQPVWSVACLFIAKGYRRQGVAVDLLNASLKFAKKNKAKIVEGYPFDPGLDLPDPFVWMGLVSSYEKAGFKEVARNSPKRPIMRVVF